MHKDCVVRTVVGCVSRKNYWLLYGTVLQKAIVIFGSKFQTYRSDAFNKIAPSTIPTSQKDNGSQTALFCGQAETLSQ